MSKYTSQILEIEVYPIKRLQTSEGCKDGVNRVWNGYAKDWITSNICLAQTESDAIMF